MKFVTGDKVKITVEGTVDVASDGYATIRTGINASVYIRGNFDNVNVEVTRALPKAERSVIEFADTVANKICDYWFTTFSSNLLDDNELLNLINQEADGKFTVIRDGA